MFTSEKYTDQLLDLYCSGQLGEESSDIVRGWLLSNDDASEKEAALVRLFEKKVRRAYLFPDGYTVSSLARLHDELGFADTNIHPRVARKRTTLDRVFRWIAGVAVTAAVLVWSVLVLPVLFDSAATVTIVADSPQGREVILPDGSTVKLKAGSSLGYVEEGFAGDRAVEIDGEGLFVVVSDGQHPFVVSAGDLSVKVLGTEFNIDAPRSEESAKVVLRSGRVEVASGERVVALEPLQRATIDLTQGTIEQETISEGDILRIWGLDLSFDGVSLSDALDLTGSYFTVAMQIADDLPDTEEIVLSLEADATLEDALFVLQTVTNAFDYRIGEDCVTITKN